MSGGGAEQFALEIIKNLIRSNYKIILGLLNFRGELIDEIPSSVQIIDLSKFSKWYSIVRANLFMRKLQNEFHFKMIFSALTTSNCFALRSSAFLKKDCKIFINIRNNIQAELSELPILKRWVKKIEIKSLYPMADQIIAVSKGVKNGLVRHFKLNKNEIEVIYNIFDIQNIQRLSKEEICFPWKDENKELKIIVASGRLVPQKGYPDLIRSFKIIHDYNQNFRLLIMGDGILYDELVAHIAELKLEKYITVMGFVKNPFPYYRLAKYSVSASLWEGFSRTLAEAKICGTVPVVSNCDYGPSEIITNNIDGVLISPGDYISMANEIIALEKDPERYASLKVSKDIMKYDKSVIMKNFEKLISRNLYSFTFNNLSGKN